MRCLKYIPFLPLLAEAALGAPAAARAASVCSGDIPSPFKPGKLSENITIQTKDGERRYRVFLPASYKQTRETPVILSFHGANGTIERQRGLDGLTEGFRNNKYIVVYLQGLRPTGEGAPDRTAWQVDPRATADDLSYTAAVLDAVESRLCVSGKEVFATGKSQGGGMVNLIACDAALGGRIAAFAPVSGAYYIHDSSRALCEPTDQVAIPNCSPSRKNLPIIAFHGGADDVIPFNGTYRAGTRSCLPDVPHWIREWAKREDLGDPIGPAQPIANSKGGNITVWGGGPMGQIRFVFDGRNIPHDWPSTVKNGDNDGKNLTAFNATEYILEFIDGRTLGA